MPFARRVEPVVDQQPRVDAQRAEVELGDLGHHQVGVGGFQRLPLRASAEADDEPEPIAAGISHSGGTVGDHRGASRGHLEPVRCLVKSAGVRFAGQVCAGGVLPVGDDIEQAGQAG